MQILQRSALAVVALSGLMVGPTIASPIPLGGGGVVNLSNSPGKLVAVSSNTPCIAFSGLAPSCPGGPTADIVSGVDPIFGTTGTIKDISTTFPIVAFETVNLTIAGGPAIWDLLNIITPSGFSNCTTSTNSGACSTGTFVLSQTSPTQVSISLSLNEIGYLGTSSTGSTPYVSVFTTQLSGDLTAFGCTGPNCADTIGNILLWESGAGHEISSTWSATESPVAATPEPASYGLIGSGLIGLVLFGRKLSKK